MFEKPVYTLEKFPEYLATITPRQWQMVFRFIPEIANTTEFATLVRGQKISENFRLASYLENSEVVWDLVKLMYDLSLVINFDWSHWKEGEKMLQAKDFQGKDTVTLLKLMTAMIRNDRFCEGYLNRCFREGVVIALLQELKKNIEKEQTLADL